MRKTTEQQGEGTKRAPRVSRCPGSPGLCVQSFSFVPAEPRGSPPLGKLQLHQLKG